MRMFPAKMSNTCIAGTPVVARRMNAPASDPVMNNPLTDEAATDRLFTMIPMKIETKMTNTNAPVVEENPSAIPAAAPSKPTCMSVKRMAVRWSETTMTPSSEPVEPAMSMSKKA